MRAPDRDRARAWFEAAWLARTNGVELLATGQGSAHGSAIGSTSIQGVISSYDLKAGGAGVTGSVLAR